MLKGINQDNRMVKSYETGIDNAPKLVYSYSYQYQELSVLSSPINDDFKIHPNPFTDKLTISSKLLTPETNLELYSENGMRIPFKTTLESKHKKIINTIQFTSGIYWLKVVNDKGCKTFKLIKK